MAKVRDDLTFINWMKTLQRKIGEINDIISDSQQHQDLSEQEVALVKKLHDNLYWSGEITFDDGCVDSSKLHVFF